MKNKAHSLLIWLALSIFTAPSAFSQAVTGTIVGVVKDPNGALVPEAVVVGTNANTGTTTTTNTNGEGFYRLTNLVPGEYTVTVEAKGFKKATVPAQRLSVNDTLRLDVNIEIGQVTESVTVEAAASEVGTEDAQLGKVIRDPSGLPVVSGVNGRNVLSLAGLMPGVVYAGQLVTTTNRIFSANGQRTISNNYFFDGGDDNDQAINTPGAVTVVSPNAIQEFRIVTGAMKAEYGRNTGSIVEVVPRSGANNWHGGASELFRNTKLNAVPFFQKSVPGGTPEAFSTGLLRKPQYNGNEFDAQFGGPIRRDKTFFFLSYEGFRRRRGVANSATVFNDAQRAAIQSQGTPEAKALLALVPSASTGNTLFSSPVDSLTRDQGLAKVDHSFSDKNHFSATYFISNDSDIAPFAFNGSSIPGFGEADKTRYQNAVLRDTHVFSPTLFNEFRASYHRLGSPSVVPLNTTKLSSLGLGAIIPDDPGAEGPPYVTISGFSVFGNTYSGPQSRFDNTFQYIDNMTWTHGRHILKFGGEFRTYAQNQVYDFINNGYIFIDGGGTQGNLVAQKIPGLSAPLNDFANGFATQFIQNSAARRGYRTRAGALFLEDDWKLRSNFTLNLGLRWEYNTGLKELADRVLAFRPGQQSTVFPDAPAGMVFPGDKGISRSTYNEDLNNFGPRFGFAWDVLSNGKLAVRGGYGIFYDAPVGELTLQFVTSAPYSIEPITLNTNYANPWLGSRANPIPQPFPFTPVAPGGQFNFAKIAPIRLNVMDPSFATPYAQQFSLQVQSEPIRDWLFDAGYVGSTGIKLLNRRNINPAIPGPGATSGNTPLRRIYNLGNPLDAQYGGAVFNSITDSLTDANSNYSSLQLAVTKRFSHGFQMTQAYTWSHSIDDASGLRVASRIDSAKADRGNSEQDVRMRYVASWTWEAPWMHSQKGGLGHMLGGWGVSGITTFQTGLPFTVTEPTDRCLCDSGNQRPDYIGGQIVTYDPRSTSAVAGRPNSWFDGTGGGSADGAPNPLFRRVGTAPSYSAGAGRFGNLGRNTMHGPGLNNWDFFLFKNIKITESHTVQFRSEFYNLWNHTQFYLPSTDPATSIGSPNFGRITQTYDPRIIQLTLRYQF